VAAGKRALKLDAFVLVGLRQPSLRTVYITPKAPRTTTAAIQNPTKLV